MTSKKWDDVVAALGECIKAAPEREQNKLAEALECYAERYYRNYLQLSKQPAMSAMLAEILETTDARIGRGDL